MSRDSGRWNAQNPERIREARRAYKSRERARRAALTPLARAKEDLERSLSRLSPREQGALVAWAARRLASR